MNEEKERNQTYSSLWNTSTVLCPNNVQIQTGHMCQEKEQIVEHVNEGAHQDVMHVSLSTDS